MERYTRQIVLPEIGLSGQKQLAEARVVVVGCGGLGAANAELLARIGIGRLTLIDPDRVEESNLPRQLLYTEADARRGTLKAQAAARRLQAINSSVEVTAVPATLDQTNATAVLAGAQVIVDATDNYRTRLLINDYCLERGIPWVYGGVAGMTGMVMPILPGRSACFRCLLPGEPGRDDPQRHAQVGVLGTVPICVASWQVTWVAKLLLAPAKVQPGLLEFNLWTGSSRQITIPRDPHCPACATR